MEIQHTLKSVRSSAILTTGYVVGTVIAPASDAGRSPVEHNQLLLYVSFTKGSLTTAEVKVEFSEDGTTYYQETFKAESGGTSTDTLGIHQYSASGNYRIAIPINDRYIKVSCHGTGTVTSSLMSVDAILAIN